MKIKDLGLYIVLGIGGVVSFNYLKGEGDKISNNFNYLIQKGLNLYELTRTELDIYFTPQSSLENNLSESYDNGNTIEAILSGNIPYHTNN